MMAGNQLHQLNSNKDDSKTFTSIQFFGALATTGHLFRETSQEISAYCKKGSHYLAKALSPHLYKTKSLTEFKTWCTHAYRIDPNSSIDLELAKLALDLNSSKSPSLDYSSLIKMTLRSSQPVPQVYEVSVALPVQVQGQTERSWSNLVLEQEYGTLIKCYVQARSEMPAIKINLANGPILARAPVAKKVVDEIQANSDTRLIKLLLDSPFSGLIDYRNRNLLPSVQDINDRQ